jgi:hypothetical protein
MITRKHLKLFIRDVESQNLPFYWNGIFTMMIAKLINTTKSVVRLGLIQWHSLGNLDALFEQAEFLSMLFLVTEVTALFQSFYSTFNGRL